jgi:hypothetical protein
VTLVEQGYRVTSRRHRMAARVDRADWREHMARQHSPWDPEGEGMAWVNALGNSAPDFYRRVYSKDKITLTFPCNRFPGSCHDPVAYVERPQ